MNSLLFQSAWQVVQDEVAACKALEFLPWNLYDVLFKVAFRNRKTLFLFNLVKMWPYPKLKVKKLLQTCQQPHQPSFKKCPDCQWTLPHNEFGKNIFDVIIQGTISHIRKAIDHGSQQFPCRRLQQLDMTGFLNNEFGWNVRFMNMWANSLVRARACIFSHQETPGLQSQAMGQVMEASPLTRIPKEVCVELLVDLQVSFKAQEFLMIALHGNANSPLHVICQDFWNANLSAEATAEFLALLHPGLLRRVDLGFRVMDLRSARYCMAQMARFQNLQSLRLCHFDLDGQWWLDARKKDDFDSFANELSKLRYLKEISVCHFHLSGQLEYMVSGIQGTLESLQLSFCFLINEDLCYLAQSRHGTNLIKLDLSGSNITDKLDSFLALLEAASDSLIYLNVTKCKLEDTHFCDTLPYLCRCKRLSHLGLFGNPLSIKSLWALKAQLQQKLLNLKLLSLPVFLDNPFHEGPSPISSESLMNYEALSDELVELDKLLFIPRQSLTECPPSCATDMGDYFDIRQWTD